MQEVSEQLIELLGKDYDRKSLAQLLQPFGVKRLPEADSCFGDDIIWSAKASLRIDVYRNPKLQELTSLRLDTDNWVVGSVMFMAPGSDDRIKSSYAGRLPHALSMTSTPDEFLVAFGPAGLDEEVEWLTYSGRILAWRQDGINFVAKFAHRNSDVRLEYFMACLVGCVGAWRSENPKLFAP